MSDLRFLSSFFPFLSPSLVYNFYSVYLSCGGRFCTLQLLSLLFLSLSNKYSQILPPQQSVDPSITLVGFDAITIPPQATMDVLIALDLKDTIRPVIFEMRL